MEYQSDRFLGSGPDSLVWHRLHQFLFHENQQPTLSLKIEEDLSDVTASTRDSYAQVLRCLKVWYDVSPECLFLSVNTMDQFLSRMKVQPKHMACIAVSCFHLALQITGEETKVHTADLLHISQSQCTVTDMSRMEQIIKKKVNSVQPTVTPLDFLSLFQAMHYLNNQHYSVPCPKINFEEMLLKLEVLICHYQCAEFKSSVLALSLFRCILETLKVSHHAKSIMMQFNDVLQDLCQIPQEEMVLCKKITLSMLDKYEHQHQSPHNQRQRLIWKLSKRTYMQLKPTARASSVLPTIKEADFSIGRPRLDSDSDGISGSETSSETMEDEDDCTDYCEMLEFWKISTNSE